MRKYRGYIAAGLLIGVLTVSGCAGKAVEAPVADVMDEGGAEQTDIVNTGSMATYPVINISDAEKQDTPAQSDIPAEITGSGLTNGAEMETDQAASDTETKQVVAGERDQAATERKAASTTEAEKSEQAAIEAVTIKAAQPATEAATTKPVQPTTEAKAVDTKESGAQSTTVQSSQTSTEAPKSAQSTTEASSTLQASTSKSVQATTEATAAKAEQATTEAPRTVQPTTEATTAKTTQPTTEAPKTSATTEATTEASTEAVHTHTWVAVYKTVKHPEEGHWEQVEVAPEYQNPIVEGHTICSNPGCGYDYTATGTNIGDHQCADGTWGSNYHNENVVVGYETVPAIYDDVWVVDKAAYREQVVDYYKCSGCGEKKAE